MTETLLDIEVRVARRLLAYYSDNSADGFCYAQAYGALRGALGGLLEALDTEASSAECSSETHPGYNIAGEPTTHIGPRDECWDPACETDPAAPSAVCGPCGHPAAAHQDGEDPVSPGRCTRCPDDDAWHNYQPAAAQPTRKDHTP